MYVRLKTSPRVMRYEWKKRWKGEKKIDQINCWREVKLSSEGSLRYK